MNFEFTEEQLMIKNTAKKFADEEIIPVARKNDTEKHFPREIINKMAELGLLGASMPSEYGGSGLDYISYALIAEEIGRGDSSVRTTVSVQVSLVEHTILKYGTEEQKRKYLPRLMSAEMIGCFALTEAEAGSDASNISTMAAYKNGKWIINGNKMWISNGGVSDIAILFAQADKSKKHKGITAFLVDTKSKGFSSYTIEGKLGLRASNTAALVLEDVEVPEDSVLGKVGDGFSIAMNSLNTGRYSVAAGCVGISSGCIDACVKYAKERKTFGKPIGSYQLVQEMIAKMVIERDAARLLVYRAGDLKNRGKKSILETSIAKYYASEAAFRAANDAIQIHGGYGYCDDFPVERYLRDAKVATIYEGTSQIQTLIIGEHVLGLRAYY
ncbi:MAG: acyl-CoA dehydrogenase family protein [Candidatus Schekmanbacteria bacterium]|nr:acyl-CoA dehydrogenase family protein [Candidatus Schekmanbacteria bacterium]